jgi:hypothetical protein
MDEYQDYDKSYNVEQWRKKNQKMDKAGIQKLKDLMEDETNKIKIG